MSDNRNMLVALALSALFMMGWWFLVGEPQAKLAQQKQQAQIALQEKQKKAGTTPVAPAAPGVGVAQSAPQALSREAALAAGGARIAVKTPTVDGSIQIKGARFDDLKLKKYRESVDPKSPEIDLLAPSGSKYPYFAQFGWSAPQGVAVPGDNTVWKVEGNSTLSPGKPVTLSWDNGHGLLFTRTVTIDDQYMFTITDSVKKTNGGGAVTLYPYALVVRDGLPQHQSYALLHEGFIGSAKGKLEDATYKDFDKEDAKPKAFDSTGGWLGITDKYWMAAVIPPQNDAFNGTFRATPYGAGKSYQANYLLSAKKLNAGGTVTVTHHFFAGAKVVNTLNAYEKDLGISRFDYAVDWGWFIALTKPLFWVLDHISRYVASFGITVSFGLAIILATIALRIILYPLANASFKSMGKMKKVQPQLEEIKKKYADDAQKQQQEMMELYKREKINPVSGCLPMLVQFPILFAFYKVQIVTIEMYHAPFWGWIKDLSAPDPTTYANLFGLLPYTVPTDLPFGLGFLLHIGIWPVLMGITQWIQFKMNPAPTDPVQAKMFALMPVIFTAMFASFPAGLVIYYTWNNILSMAQQAYMMKREGVEIHLFKNLPFSRKAA
ncbi:YidC/Oxa1 family membrane protein insertase [Rhizomicrobium palustre]|uniref:Membrane protein insertase YidC n=1 Tax=Rhizomicrobium palustre TaxID=189966 RepID=A0A846MWZ6_9PROT|nr:membrane protein insertase YidC [Rhizomicrobium palustre]NIK87853.1 YidC/Oxa1 family membrane protein insertase [Rhizomicrobium palustre]